MVEYIMEFSISGILAVLFMYTNMYYIRKVASVWNRFYKLVNEEMDQRNKGRALIIRYLNLLKNGYYVLPLTYLRYLCRNFKLYMWHTSKDRESTDNLRIMIGDILFESIMVIYYHKIRVELNEKIVEFKWKNFPVINNAGMYYTFKELQIDINLEKKSMVKVLLDNRNITPQETFILVCFYSFFLNTTKIEQLSRLGHDLAYLDSTVVNYMAWVGLPMLVCPPKRSILPTIKGKYDLFIHMLRHYYGKNHYGNTEHHAIDYQRLVHLVEHSKYVRFVWNTHTRLLNAYPEPTFPKKYIEALFADTILKPLESVRTANYLKNLTRMELATLDFEFLIHISIYLHPIQLSLKRKLSDAEALIIKELLQYGKKVNSTLVEHIEKAV